MPQTDQDRTVALAGLFQATHLVRSIARTGQVDEGDFETCIASLFKIDAESSVAVYGGLPRLKTGLQLLAGQLRQPQDMEVTRYVLNLLVLERKLRSQNRLLTTIRNAIEASQEKLHYFSPTHDNIIASLADLYANTISTLTPKIMVSGDPAYLSQQENANRIRALLLAGIRSALLWHQSGGGRLTLLFRRKAILLQAQRMLDSLEPVN